MTQREFNFFQALGIGRSSYKVPAPTAPVDRPRDRAIVDETRPIDWGLDIRSHAVRHDLIGLPRAEMPWRSTRMEMQGRPIMAASANQTMAVHWFHPEYGIDRTVRVPKPLDGPVWIEDFPRTRLQLEVANWSNRAHYDRHVILVKPDGECHEMIQYADVLHAPRVKGWGRWSPDGELLDGRSVVAGGNQMTPLALGHDDVTSPSLGHRLSLTVRAVNYQHQDPDVDEYVPKLGTWLALDPAKVPAGLPPRAQLLANMLCNNGVLVADHGGDTKLNPIPGSWWNDIDWGHFAPKLSDFREVTSEL